MQQDLTPKQQTSEAIRQAETILITTGQHPSVDQITAVLALSAVLRKFGKKVSVIVSDSLPTQVSFLDASMVSQTLSGLRDFIMRVDLKKAEVDKLRYEVEDGKLNVFITPFQGGFAPSDVSFDYGDYHFDLAIILGVPTRARIDRVYADNQSLFSTIPVLNLDYHRSNENYGAVNLIESTASSLCEILVALSESLQTGLIDADIATIMLTGLMSSTDRFTASHTTSKSMTVAAQLMAAGARQQMIVKGLYRDNRDSSDRQSPRADQPPRRDQPPRHDDPPRQDQSVRRDQPPRQDQPPRHDQPPRSDRPVRQDQAPFNDRFARQDNGSVPQARQEASRPESAPRPEPALHQITPSRDEPSSPVMTPAPTPTTSLPRAEAEPVQMYEPIIDPGHIELSQMGNRAETSNQPANDVPAMADFAAAAQFLRRDNQSPEQNYPRQSEKPAADTHNDADHQSGDKRSQDEA
jgi:hypothetical protein